jgi:hypothetical protein
MNCARANEAAVTLLERVRQQRQLKVATGGRRSGGRRQQLGLIQVATVSQTNLDLDLFRSS